MFAIQIPIAFGVDNFLGGGHNMVKHRGLRVLLFFFFTLCLTLGAVLGLFHTGMVPSVPTLDTALLGSSRAGNTSYSGKAFAISTG